MSGAPVNARSLSGRLGARRPADVGTLGYGRWSTGEPATDAERELLADGWRRGNDDKWRTDRFGGAYKSENALRRLGSKRGEPTS